MAEYDGSTETQEAFCEAHDVPLGTFRYWRYKLAKQRPTRFLPVEVVGSPAPVARAGALVVAAAGNLGQQEPREYPASDTKVLGVAATDPFDVKAPFSNFGPRVGLCGPGHSLTMPKNPKAFNPTQSMVSTVPGGGFGIWRGTSFSCALV